MVRHKLAAYELTPTNESREALHLRIGRRMQERASAMEMEDFIFMICDQLNRGAALVTERQEQLGFAQMNLRAGEKAISSSAFQPAAAYFKAGISMLEEKDWETHYELCLGLYESAAESEYCIGRFREMELLLQQVFNKAKSFEDKLRSYNVLISALAGQGDIKTAMDTAFAVLNNLGETFPKLGDDEVMMADIERTGQMIGDKTNSELLKLDAMEDEGKLAAMQFLNLLVLYCYMTKPKILPRIIFRMVQLSLKYGMCKESAYGFALYGLISCFSDPRGGHRFGELSLLLLNRFNATDLLARVYAAVYGCVNHWTKPLHLCLEPLVRAHKTGLLTGDIEFSSVCGEIYICSAFQCGKTLGPLAKEMESYINQMREHKQEHMVDLSVPMYQTVLILMGGSNDPVQSTGEIMDAALNDALEQNNAAGVQVICLFRLLLAYLFGDYERAADIAEVGHDMQQQMPGKPEIYFHTFLEGLTALYLARATKKSKWRIIAHKAVERMKNWAGNSQWNCQHKLILLKAETFFLEENEDKAAETYDDAIALAGEHGFVHEQAIACERAGDFYAANVNNSKASHYYSRAHQYYIQWGAQAKADRLHNQIAPSS